MIGIGLGIGIGHWAWHGIGHWVRALGSGIAGEAGGIYVEKCNNDPPTRLAPTALRSAMIRLAANDSPPHPFTPQSMVNGQWSINN